MTVADGLRGRIGCEVSWPQGLQIAGAHG